MILNIHIVKPRWQLLEYSTINFDQAICNKKVDGYTHKNSQ